MAKTSASVAFCESLQGRSGYWFLCAMLPLAYTLLRPFLPDSRVWRSCRINSSVWRSCSISPSDCYKLVRDVQRPQVNFWVVGQDQHNCTSMTTWSGSQPIISIILNIQFSSKNTFCLLDESNGKCGTDLQKVISFSVGKIYNCIAVVHWKLKHLHVVFTEGRKARFTDFCQVIIDFLFLPFPG